MKKKVSNKLFITFSLCTLLIGLVALQYLGNISKAKDAADSVTAAEDGTLNSACYTESEDPFITQVDPNCN